MFKKIVPVLAVLVAFVGVNVATAADLCWSMSDGNFVEVNLESVRTGVFAVTGTVNDTIPVSGTGVDTGGNLRLGFNLVHAGVGLYAVTWDFNIDPTTLDGSGYWRWFNDDSEGAFDATNVSCFAARPESFGLNAATGSR